MAFMVEKKSINCAGGVAQCEIQGKEITLLIGNTGAGKSTLINYLMGCKMRPTLGMFGGLRDLKPNNLP